MFTLNPLPPQIDPALIELLNDELLRGPTRLLDAHGK